MRLIITFACISLVLLSGCNEHTEKSSAENKVQNASDLNADLIKGQVEEHRMTVKGGHPYCLYLPSEFDTLHKFPVTILLDPQGDAKEIIDRYRSIAEDHQRILLCSEEFKNGTDADRSLTIISSLTEEAVNHLRADPSAVNLMGFSGGARAAILASSQLTGISSLTYCGAAPPPGSTRLSIPSLGIAGVRDMNFTEVLYFTSSLDTTNTKPSMLATATRHEWPDTATFRLISGWAEVASCRKSSRCDSGLLASTAALTRNRIYSQKDPIIRDLLLRFMVSTFDGYFPLDKEKKEMESNIKSASFSNALNVFRSALQFETTVRQEFADAFKTKDILWWKSKLDELRKNESDPVFDRLLGHVSLAAYTYSRISIDRNNAQDAEYFLQLYEIADPENPEWALLRACLSEQSGDRNATVNYLDKANRMGLNESEKISQEKWLQNAVSDSRVVSIMQRMDSGK